MTYLDPQRVEIVYQMPLAEIVLDFYDRLKSISRDTPRWTTKSPAIDRPSSSSSTSSLTAIRSTRSA